MEYDFNIQDFVEETKEEKEERLYKETYTKSLKTAKIALVSTFAGLTVLFIALAFVFNFTLDLSVDDNYGGLISMIVMSIVMFITTLIILVIPFKVPDYKKFKKANDKWGFYSTYDLIARIEILEKRVEELESKLKK